MAAADVPVAIEKDQAVRRVRREGRALAVDDKSSRGECAVRRHCGGGDAQVFSRQGRQRELLSRQKSRMSALGVSGVSDRYTANSS